MIIWVPIWFTIVILVTTLNKTLFTSLKCPYPLSITMVHVIPVFNLQIHMLSCAVYSTLMKYTAPNFFKYRPLTEGELRNLILVSVIFIVNIALSNSSLKFNSLALDQVFSFFFLSESRCSAVLCRFSLVYWSLSSMAKSVLF